MRKTDKTPPHDNPVSRHNPRLEVKPSTADDFKAFYGFYNMPFSAQSLSFFLDGELKGVGGVRFAEGYFLAFSDFDESVKVNGATLYRCALEIMKVVKDMKSQVFALAKNESTAPRLLTRLGFTLFASHDEQEVYVYG